jgi:hypothetical protein
MAPACAARTVVTISIATGQLLGHLFQSVLELSEVGPTINGAHRRTTVLVTPRRATVPPEGELAIHLNYRARRMYLLRIAPCMV